RRHRNRREEVRAATRTWALPRALRQNDAAQLVQRIPVPGSPARRPTAGQRAGRRAPGSGSGRLWYTLSAMLELSPQGLYCSAGDFWIDPWTPVSRAVITHGHGDHARWGSLHYLAAAPNAGILRRRLRGANVETVAYGEERTI